MPRKLIISCVTAALFAGGCSSGNSVRTGALAALAIPTQRPAEKSAPAAANSDSPVHRDDTAFLAKNDVQLAEAAEREALERGSSGVARRWKNSATGTSGEVVPSRPYKRGVTDCRDFTHIITVSGETHRLRGSACRDIQGSWTKAS